MYDHLDPNHLLLNKAKEYIIARVTKHIHKFVYNNDIASTKYVKNTTHKM